MLDTTLATLPCSADIFPLPRLARLAFSARCLRWARSSLGDTDQRARSCHRLIDVGAKGIEARASLGSRLGKRYASAGAGLARCVEAMKRGPAGSYYIAAAAAVAVENCAAEAQPTRARGLSAVRVAEVTRLSVHAVRLAAGLRHGELERVVNGLLDDLDSLQTRAAADGWTDETAVHTSFFSLLPTHG